MSTVWPWCSGHRRDDSRRCTPSCKPFIPAPKRLMAERASNIVITHVPCPFPAIIQVTSWMMPRVAGSTWPTTDMVRTDGRPGQRIIRAAVSRDGQPKEACPSWVCASTARGSNGFWPREPQPSANGFYGRVGLASSQGRRGHWRLESDRNGSVPTTSGGRWWRRLPRLTTVGKVPIYNTMSKNMHGSSSLRRGLGLPPTAHDIHSHESH